MKIQILSQTEQLVKNSNLILLFMDYINLISSVNVGKSESDSYNFYTLDEFMNEVVSKDGLSLFVSETIITFKLTWDEMDYANVFKTDIKTIVAIADDENIFGCLTQYVMASSAETVYQLYSHKPEDIMEMIKNRWNEKKDEYIDLIDRNFEMLKRKGFLAIGETVFIYDKKA